MRYFCLFLFLLIISACSGDDNSSDPINPASQPNILLIIADDMGKDATPGFSEGSIKPNTPNLNDLRNQGLVFSNLWVYPTCSPTRASIITGKYGYRTGVQVANDELSQSETSLQQFIKDGTNNAYSTAIIGKWHLSGDNTSINPESFGIDYYVGLIRGGVQSYYQWQISEDGTGSLETEYTSKVFVDLAINWVNTQSKPWFLWLAFNAPHTPFHVPPSNMHTQGNLPDYDTGLDPMPYYMAAIEAMDYQIGALLDNIPQDVLENTIIFFIGDNGTPNQVAQSPFSNNTVKGTLYQGGINTPLLVSGAGVSRTGEDDNLICSTDLFSTISDLVGVDNPDIHDSKSFKPLLTTSSVHRDFQYSDMRDDTDDAWAISNGAYKLIVNANGNEQFYHLLSDPYETSNLLNGTLSPMEENAKQSLETELSTIRN